MCIYSYIQVNCVTIMQCLLTMLLLLDALENDIHPTCCSFSSIRSKRTWLAEWNSWLVLYWSPGAKWSLFSMRYTMAGHNAPGTIASDLGGHELFTAALVVIQDTHTHIHMHSLSSLPHTYIHCGTVTLRSKEECPLSMIELIRLLN